MIQSIKPEDITESLIDDYMKFRLGPDDPLIWQQHFQSLCGLLIKHGIVSPPVYCERYRDGRLKKSPFGHVQVFTEGQEHWKGQAE